MRRPAVETSMMRNLTALLLFVTLSACGDGAPLRADRPIPLQEVLDDAASWDGERVRVRAGYYGAFEQSVLTSGFAESFPPQPVEPLVWVDATPPSPCLERQETQAWAEGVVATGVFEAGGGFGHLNQYPFQLTGASIRCA